MTNTTCDKCGRKKRGQGTWLQIKSYGTPDPDIDLCDRCFDDLREWVFG